MSWSTYVQSFDIDIAEDENLDDLIHAFINLPRRNQAESDATFRARFRAISVQQNNPRRTTRRAIRDAIRYLVSDAVNVAVVEKFSTRNLYFQVRVSISATGTADLEELFLNSDVQGFLDQFFVGGVGIGGVVAYIPETIRRVKAAGVEFDLVLISQGVVEKTSNAVVV